MHRVLTVNIKDYSKIAKALSNPIRIELFQLLLHQPMNINEISEHLNMPTSSVAVNIQKLEEAGLVRSELLPGARGSQKVCSAVYDKIVIETSRSKETNEENVIVTQMPIGLYVDCHVTPTCGLLSAEAIIGMLDDPRTFYEPEHVNAQLLWFRNGYVEYRFPNKIPFDSKAKKLEVSLEICSEAPLHKNDWPSDITMWINSKEIGTWMSPGDFGGTRGHLTPTWWDIDSSQYGLLKKWSVSNDGTYIDGNPLSDTTIQDLEIDGSSYITLRIGVKEDAVNCGGVNLFGRLFGNYGQDIILKQFYESKMD
ncbi:helix-turn-helix domain-containing protein [Fodinisporobacter ferrooxydans]|uniref:Helix-turn-helix domain-containing protein n=1 Tax=Fodinisporobacter ferrooxydans TaxID=2901836 RepID=A0ABY4CJF8_9BACL|nr:helix-turn-helix domain-containing protein [Alicyclobacillaceae bacterium MYW30-H2]